MPYPQARLTDLRLNGHPLGPLETNGYMSWTARGYTYFQINMPPERSKSEHLFLVTCQYDPGEVRRHWQLPLIRSKIKEAGK